MCLALSRCLSQPELERILGNITRQKQSFERFELTKEEALDMFRYNAFKVTVAVCGSVLQCVAEWYSDVPCECSRYVPLQRL